MSETNRRDDAAPAHDEAPVEQDQTPSLRFRIFFTVAMIVIAVGYTWVWRAKTERVVPEPVPVLALNAAVTETTQSGGAFGDALLQQLRLIRGLTVLDARARHPSEPEIAQLLSAELKAGDSGHVLALRRTDAKTGDVLYDYRVEGTTPDEALYRMSVQIAMSFGLPRPPARAAEAAPQPR